MLKLETAEVYNDNLLQCSKESTSQLQSQGREVITNYSQKDNNVFKSNSKRKRFEKHNILCKNNLYENNPIFTSITKKVKLDLNSDLNTKSIYESQENSINESCPTQESEKYENSRKNSQINETVEEIQLLLANLKFIALQDISLINSENFKFQVKCQLNHIMLLNLQNIRQIQSCLKCSFIFNKAKNYAASMNATILNQSLNPELNIKCQNGHEFKINYKYITKKWCQKCKQIQQSYLKQDQQKRKQDIFLKNNQKQEDLFKQARYNMFNQNSSSSSYQQENLDNYSQFRILYAFKETESEIEQLAANYAKQYQNYEDAFYVYKILLLSENILQLYFQALDKNQLKLEYKQYARRLHPDKNKHEKSGIAFRKLKDLYDQTLFK